MLIYLYTYIYSYIHKLLIIVFVRRKNEKEKSFVGFMFICLFLKGKRCKGRKNVKYTDSYDIIDLSICYVQSLFLDAFIV